MKRFPITAALTLALSLLPVGAFADDPQTAPQTSAPTEGAVTNAGTEKIAPPILDLMFCIDTNASMQDVLPYVKATVPVLIRREKARYPGYTVRLGLMRYSPSKGPYVLGLSENQDRFLEVLQQTECVEAVTTIGGAGISREHIKQMAWSEHGVRRMYMIGNGAPFTGGWSWMDILTARKNKVIVSGAFCHARPFGDPKASDEWNVRDWIFVDLHQRGYWMEIADATGGEYMQIFSHKDGTAATGQPLLGVVWNPRVASEFNRYLSRPSRLNHLTFDHFRNTVFKSDILVKSIRVPPGSINPVPPDAAPPPSLGGRGLVVIPASGVTNRVHFPGNEASVIRYFEGNLSSVTDFLRP